MNGFDFTDYGHDYALASDYCLFHGLQRFSSFCPQVLAMERVFWSDIISNA